ncbi:tRNA 5-methylaminomethyl-2-thiouridine biosynthesis bifunctional protein MnmC [Castellaniella defragrans]
MRIGIAGAGVLGRLLAWRLSRAGHEVTVLDPADGPLGRGAAGWTAAGMLSPSAELECADLRVFQAGVDSLQQWAEIVPQLPGSPDFDCHGSLLLAHRGDQGAAHHLVDLIEHKAPEAHRPQALTPSELAALEPDIHGPSLAWFLPHEGAVNPLQLMPALYEGAPDVHWLWNHTVRFVKPGLLQTEDRNHPFDHVFDVRGLGQRPLTGRGTGCGAVRGVRGEIFLVQAPEVHLARPVRLLHPRHRVYIVPRRNHHFIIGASEIESEDRSPVSLRTTVELLAAAHIRRTRIGRLGRFETGLGMALEPSGQRRQVSARCAGSGPERHHRLSQGLLPGPGNHCPQPLPGHRQAPAGLRIGARSPRSGLWRPGAGRRRRSVRPLPRGRRRPPDRARDRMRPPG